MEALAIIIVFWLWVDGTKTGYMRRRDKFAVQAMNAILNTDQNRVAIEHPDGQALKGVAESAYRMADAMIEVRDRDEKSKKEVKNA